MKQIVQDILRVFLKEILKKSAEGCVSLVTDFFVFKELLGYLLSFHHYFIF